MMIIDVLPDYTGRKENLMIAVTTHAKRRLKERCGVNKQSAVKMAERAFRQGISFDNAGDSIKKYISSVYLCHQKMCNNIRIYGDMVYIFDNQTLITVYPIPKSISDEMEELASSIDVVADNMYKYNLRQAIFTPEIVRYSKRKQVNLNMITNFLKENLEKEDIKIRRVGLKNDHIGLYIEVKGDGLWKIPICDMQMLAEMLGITIKCK